jgi:hypothetical protein
MSLLDSIRDEHGRKAGPLPMQRPGFVHRIGQSRRLVIGRLISMTGGVAIFLYWLFWTGTSWGVWIGLGGTLVGLTGFVWECVSVRCPRCRAAVVWKTFNTRSPNAAQVAIWNQATCPACGYDPP